MSSNPNTPNISNLIQIAQLKKPYGIKGWLWVFSNLDEREDIFTMNPWWMKTARGLQPLTLTKWRKQGSGLVAQFNEIPDRNVAETMNGVTIWASKENLPEPDEDEYYWSDLVGLTVVNQGDICLGTIDELFETGANDVMVVIPSDISIDSEKRLIPWHKQTIVSVDINHRKVIVNWEVDY